MGSSGKTLLKNIGILNMDDEDIRRGDILIEKGKILKISPVPLPRLAEAEGVSIDGSGKFVMPSLFDMHVHLNSSEMLDLFIANGITGVRNMWGFPRHLEWKRRIEEGDLRGPFIYSTGPLTDGVTYWEGSQIVTTPEEGERAVIKNQQDGYLFFKTYPSIPKDAYLKVLMTAREHHFRVCGHGSSSLSWKTLADFGYYCCEHTNCLPDDPSDIEYMAKSGMWLCPTHVVIKTIEDYVYGSASFADLPYYGYVSPRGRKEWDKITAWRKTNGRYNLNEGYPMGAIIARGKKFIAAAGTEKILLGTDTDNPGVTAGFSIHDELKYLVELYGLSKFEALRAGTVNAAKHLDLENQKGRLLEGFDADLLILNGNPLEKIENTGNIDSVIQGGRIYTRQDLDGILAKVRSLKDEEIVFIDDTGNT
jgi:imidazolonepropionase-like amidohydrolase